MDNKELKHREVSHSQLGMFKKCRRQFKYSYIDKLETKTARRPLKFGSDFHELEEAYQDDKHDENQEGTNLRVKNVLARIYKEFKALPEKDKEALGYRYCEDLTNTFKSFIYQRNKNKSYRKEELIYNEQEFKLKLSEHVTLKGIIDRVVRIDGKYYVKELKTYGKYKPKLEDLVWQAQHYLYAKYVEKALGITVSGFIYEYVTSTPPADPVPSPRGLLARQGNTHTTTPMFKAKMKRPPNKQEAIVLAEADSKYYVRIIFPMNKQTAKVVLSNFNSEAKRVVEAIATEDYNTFLADAFLCGYCDYKPLCEAVYTLGEDVEEELKSNYDRRE